MQLHRVDTRRGFFYRHTSTAFDGYAPKAPPPPKKFILLERVKITKIKTPSTSFDRIEYL